MIMVSRLMLKPIKLPIKAKTWWFGGPMVANGGQWWPTKLFCEFPIIPASPPWLGRSQSSLNKSGPEPIFCWKALPPKTTSWVNQEKAWNSFKNITFLLPQGWPKPTLFTSLILLLDVKITYLCNFALSAGNIYARKRFAISPPLYKHMTVALFQRK